jgi:hypothetical protein
MNDHGLVVVWPELAHSGNCTHFVSGSKKMQWQC